MDACSIERQPGTPDFTGISGLCVSFWGYFGDILKGSRIVRLLFYCNKKRADPKADPLI